MNLGVPKSCLLFQGWTIVQNSQHPDISERGESGVETYSLFKDGLKVITKNVGEFTGSAGRGLCADVSDQSVAVLLHDFPFWYYQVLNTGRKSSQTNLRKCTGSAGRGRRADVSAPLLGQLLFAQQRERVELAPTY